MPDRDMKSPPPSGHPWRWVPSLYFAEGLPLVVISTVSVILYKKMGISNSSIAFWTGLLYLPWVLKGIWSPAVDVLRTKREWIVTTEFVMGTAFAVVAILLPGKFFFPATIAAFWLAAFFSATHDIAADGFYLLGLDKHQQVWFCGIRNTFYRLAVITGQGLLVMSAGFFEDKMSSIATAWMTAMLILAGGYLLLAAYHLLTLPRPDMDHAVKVGDGSIKPNPAAAFLASFKSFFTKPGVWGAVAFLMLYRLGESQLVKLASPFLLDPGDAGGLALDTGQVGFVYGTVGVSALTIGGLAGAFLAARFGLKKCIWGMACAINLPNLVYIYLANAAPDNLFIINACVALEQFGYGVGFTGYMLYMVYFAEDSEYKAAHYAVMTGFMALGMMLPGMAAGWIQERIGYANFFIWVMISTLPGFLSLLLIRIDPGFGRKQAVISSE